MIERSEIEKNIKIYIKKTSNSNSGTENNRFEDLNKPITIYADYKNDKQVVLLIHGIRTAANWAEMVRANLLDGKSIEYVYILRYGFFDIFKFLFPGPWRNSPINNLTSEIHQVIDKHPNTYISILAHSYGTYIISKILNKHTYIKIYRLCLCGSIIHSKFRWERIKPQIFGDIVNDCGEKDFLPVLAKTLTFGFGATGRLGINSIHVKNRFHDLNHSGFFTKNFIKEFWLPFIDSGIINRTKDEREEPRKSPSYILLLLSSYKLILILPIVIIMYFSFWH